MTNALSDAISHFQNQRFRVAEKACRRALKQSPESADAHHLMAALKSRSGDVKSAVRHLEKTVTLSPSHTEAQYNLGKGYRDLERYAEAVTTFEKVLHTWPSRADLWMELGLAIGKLGDLSRSADAFERAISLGANSPDIHTELGRTYVENYNFDAAEISLQRALTLDPQFVPAKVNLAILKENLGQTEDSIDIYNDILSSDPTCVQASYRRALVLLMRGHLNEGWTAYMQRSTWDLAQTCHGQMDAPYWSGEDLSGKALLVWTEQGPGDEILLGSMLNDLVETTAHVTLACSPRLTPVFQRSFPKFKVVTQTNSKLPRKEIGVVDYQASLTEIGAALRPNINGFPKPHAYLKSNESQRDALRQKYAGQHRDRPVVGLSWRSTNKDASRHKSTDILKWAPILKDHDANFVSLQYGDTTEERSILLEQAGIELTHDSDIDPLTDMDAFIDQAAAMDLVISTSNTTVHAAGGVGTECWTLAPEGTGRPWYWFLDRPDCLWYPSMRLYRQAHAGDWGAPLSAVRDDFAQWMNLWPNPN